MRALAPPRSPAAPAQRTPLEEGKGALDAELSAAEQLAELQAQNRALREELEELGTELVEAQREARELRAGSQGGEGGGSLLDELGAVEQLGAAQQQQRLAELTAELAAAVALQAEAERQVSEQRARADDLDTELRLARQGVVRAESRLRRSASGEKKLELALADVQRLDAERGALLQRCAELGKQLAATIPEAAHAEQQRKLVASNVQLKTDLREAQAATAAALADLQLMRAKQSFLNEQLVEAQCAAAPRGRWPARDSALRTAGWLPSGWRPGSRSCSGAARRTCAGCRMSSTRRTPRRASSRQSWTLRWRTKANSGRCSTRASTSSSRRRAAARSCRGSSFLPRTPASSGPQAAPRFRMRGLTLRGGASTSSQPALPRRSVS